jgi:hypothetical protein
LGKISLITLNPDGTFTEKKRRTYENLVDVKEEFPAEFTQDAIFREQRSKIERMKFWKSRRYLGVRCAGAKHLATIIQQSENAVNWSYGTPREAKDFVYKWASKAKLSQKERASYQIIILLLGIVNIVFSFMILRGVGIIR